MLTFEKIYLSTFLFSPPLDCMLSMVVQELALRDHFPVSVWNESSLSDKNV